MPETTAELTPDELNPRQITKEQKDRLDQSLKKFGDLSGIVFNRRTRKLVGGHQRTSLFGPDCEIHAKYLDKPDEQGTVGMGYVILKDGAKHGYREVDWPKEFAYAANIAANAHGGSWEESKLREMLTLVSEDPDIKPDVLGLQPEFMESLFRGQDLKLNVQELENKALEFPLTQHEIENLPSQTQMVQIFMTNATRPAFIQKCKELQVLWATPNITETIMKAVEQAHEACKKGDGQSS